MSKLIINGYRDFHGMHVNKTFDSSQYENRADMIKSMAKSFLAKDEAELTQVVEFTVVKTTLTDKELSECLDLATNLPKASAKIFG